MAKLVINKDVAERLKQKQEIREVEGDINSFNAFFGEVKSKFVGRDAEIDQIRQAILMREHVLLKGKPGTAKSLLARTVFHHIDGDVNVFEIQFSKFMSEDYVFGPINIRTLRKKGMIEHNTEGSIIEADFAFVDEFFDGSDVLIRSLLEVLNERTFTRNVQQIKCKLHSAVLTSNYVRDDESMEAISDRIIFKSTVNPLASKPDRLKMYKSYIDRVNGNGTLPLKTRISIGLIKKLTDKVQGVAVEQEVLSYYDDVLKEFVKQTGKYISDRTANKALNCLRISAILAGRMEAEVDDIMSVKTVFCDSADDKENKFFDGIFDKLVVKGREEIYEMRSFNKEFSTSPYKTLAATRWDADKEKNDLKLLKEENKMIKTLSDKMGEYHTEGPRNKLQGYIRELEGDINRIKSELSL